MSERSRARVFSRLAFAVSLCGTLVAHGGAYRGPGELLPPHLRAMAKAAEARGAAARPILRADLTQWQFWWEFNKAGYQPPKTPGKRLPAKQKKRIIDALKKAMMAADSRPRMVSACMMALAKMGGHATFLTDLKSFLPNKQAELPEVAILAMGVLGRKSSVPSLIEFARDSLAARKLAGRKAIDVRMRSFAFYALGLIANITEEVSVRKSIFRAAQRLLLDDEAIRTDVLVAAITSIRLIRLTDKEDSRVLNKIIVSFVRDVMLEPKYPALLRSHAILTLAKHGGRTDDARALFCKQLVERLKSPTWQRMLQEFTVLALGQIGTPRDVAVIDVLETYLSSGRDVQTRNFCAIALGQIGGEKALNILLDGRRGLGKRHSKPWCALGLGIMSLEERRLGAGKVVKPAVAEELFQLFQKTGNRLYAAADAIALGLMRHEKAAKAIANKAKVWKLDGEPSGYLLRALGLMGNVDSTEAILNIVQEARRRPQLRIQGSLALSMLADKEQVSELNDLLRGRKNTLGELASFAFALGHIKEPATADALIALLEDKTSPRINRAFAAVALGILGNEKTLPWNSAILHNTNYRRMVETLSGQRRGIFDIL